jgi:hypothetical protein
MMGEHSRSATFSTNNIGGSKDDPGSGMKSKSMNGMGWPMSVCLTHTWFVSKSGTSSR